MRPALNNPALNAPTTDVAARDCKQPGCFHQPGCGAFVFWRFLVWLSSVLDPDEGARHGLVGLATLCRGIRENSDQTSMRIGILTNSATRNHVPVEPCRAPANSPYPGPM